MQEEETRTLFSGTGLCKEQSAINISNLREHVYDYSLLAMKGLEFVLDPPEKILVIGLGGGIVPREMRYLLPDAEIDIIEIDETIIKVAKEFFFFEEDDNMTIHQGDAFVITREMEGKYDFIVLDAFMGNYIPFPLMSSEFISRLKDISSDKALLTVNSCNTHPSFLSQINTFRSVFGDNIYRVDGSRNEYSTTLYVSKGEGVELPDKMDITEEIENAKIFSLSNP